MMRFSRKPRTLGTALASIALLIGGAALAADEPATRQTLAPLTPLSPSYERMTGDELFAKLLEGNRARDARLRQYSATRTYRVSNDKGKLYAQEVVEVEYQAPDHKGFRTVSEEGSGVVRDMVLKRLIESESETSSGRAHHDSAIKPANYEFNLLGEQDVGPYHCLVAEAIPKRRDKYLFEGKVWIDAEDYAIVRIDGQPAKSLSFWITRADFVRQYQKIGEFWVPEQDNTLVHVRLYGKKMLTIDHRDYVINCAIGASSNDLARDKQMADQISDRQLGASCAQGHPQTGVGQSE
jgi:outer membrane lipoprotein-sorting protein